MKADLAPGFDGWTVVHALFGAALGAKGVDRFTAYAAIIGTEVLELYLRRHGIRLLAKLDESSENVIVDLVVGITAYEVATK